MNKKNLSSMIDEHKTILTIILIGFLLMELQIFAVAAGKSGKESWVKVYDANGNVIHQVKGARLGDSDRQYVEKTFGPLRDFDVRLVAGDVPFPFRAWFAAAVGLPVAVVLLFSFIVKVYAALFYGDEGSRRHEKEDLMGTTSPTRLDDMLMRLGRYNVYTIGVLIFLAVFAFWVVPNFFVFIGKLGVESLIRFKWFFLAAAVVAVAVAVWIIYLRYLLAKKAMDAQMETEKYRLELEYGLKNRSVQRIEYRLHEMSPKAVPEKTGSSRH